MLILSQQQLQNFKHLYVSKHRRNFPIKFTNWLTSTLETDDIATQFEAILATYNATQTSEWAKKALIKAFAPQLYTLVEYTQKSTPAKSNPLTLLPTEAKILLLTILFASHDATDLQHILPNYKPLFNDYEPKVLITTLDKLYHDHSSKFENGVLNALASFIDPALLVDFLTKDHANKPRIIDQLITEATDFSDMSSQVLTILVRSGLILTPARLKRIAPTALYDLFMQYPTSINFFENCSIRKATKVILQAIAEQQFSLVRDLYRAYPDKDDLLNYFLIHGRHLELLSAYHDIPSAKIALEKTLCKSFIALVDQYKKTATFSAKENFQRAFAITLEDNLDLALYFYRAMAEPASKELETKYSFFTNAQQTPAPLSALKQLELLSQLKINELALLNRYKPTYLPEIEKIYTAARLDNAKSTTLLQIEPLQSALLQALLPKESFLTHPFHALAKLIWIDPFDLYSKQPNISAAYQELLQQTPSVQAALLQFTPAKAALSIFKKFYFEQNKLAAANIWLDLTPIQQQAIFNIAANCEKTAGKILDIFYELRSQKIGDDPLITAMIIRLVNASPLAFTDIRSKKENVRKLLFCANTAQQQAKIIDQLPRKKTIAALLNQDEFSLANLIALCQKAKPDTLKKIAENLGNNKTLSLLLYNHCQEKIKKALFINSLHQDQLIYGLLQASTSTNDYTNLAFDLFKSSNEQGALLFNLMHRYQDNTPAIIDTLLATCFENLKFSAYHLCQITYEYNKKPSDEANIKNYHYILHYFFNLSDKKSIIPTLVFMLNLQGEQETYIGASVVQQIIISFISNSLNQTNVREIINDENIELIAKQFNAYHLQKNLAILFSALLVLKQCDQFCTEHDIQEDNKYILTVIVHLLMRIKQTPQLFTNISPDKFAAIAKFVVTELANEEFYHAIFKPLSTKQVLAILAILANLANEKEVATKLLQIYDIQPKKQAKILCQLNLQEPATIEDFLTHTLCTLNDDNIQHFVLIIESLYNLYLQNNNSLWTDFSKQLITTAMQQSDAGKVLKTLYRLSNGLLSEIWENILLLNPVKVSQLLQCLIDELAIEKNKERAEFNDNQSRDFINKFKPTLLAKLLIPLSNAAKQKPLCNFNESVIKPLFIIDNPILPTEESVNLLLNNQIIDFTKENYSEGITVDNINKLHKALNTISYLYEKGTNEDILAIIQNIFTVLIDQENFYHVWRNLLQFDKEQFTTFLFNSCKTNTLPLEKFILGFDKQPKEQTEILLAITKLEFPLLSKQSTVVETITNLLFIPSSNPEKKEQKLKKASEIINALLPEQQAERLLQDKAYQNLIEIILGSIAYSEMNSNNGQCLLSIVKNIKNIRASAIANVLADDSLAKKIKELQNTQLDNLNQQALDQQGLSKSKRSSSSASCSYDANATADTDSSTNTLISCNEGDNETDVDSYYSCNDNEEGSYSNPKTLITGIYRRFSSSFNLFKPNRVMTDANGYQRLSQEEQENTGLSDRVNNKIEY